MKESKFTKKPTKLKLVTYNIMICDIFRLTSTSLNILISTLSSLNHMYRISELNPLFATRSHCCLSIGWMQIKFQIPACVAPMAYARGGSKGGSLGSGDPPSSLCLILKWMLQLIILQALYNYGYNWLDCNNKIVN